MNIHEYQAKQILKKYGVPLSDYQVLSSVEELPRALDALGTEEVVLKVQVHAGGRGKAGGVKVARTAHEAASTLKSLLGMKIVNRQTGPDGVVAEKVLISPLVKIKKEYYLAAIIDRESASGLLIASTEGGMEIEEVAAKHPEKIVTLPLPTGKKLRGYQLFPFVKALGWSGPLAAKGVKLILSMIEAFVASDAMLLEINPLILTEEGELLALDAKLTVDENALFRQPELASFYDPSQVCPREREAKEHDLAYIALEGSVGCMVNGAGLAMATMDLIQAHGERPANFLDVGGGASRQKVAEGFKIILEDPQVKAVLVNIFGGIMNCETLAEGILEATRELGIKVPLVVRMEGTNVEKGRALLAGSGLNIILAEDLADAAQKIGEAIRK